MATWATLGIDIYMSILDMATWAAICMTPKWHIIPLHSDGPYGPAHWCGPLSWECDHTGHNRYRYYHTTHVATWDNVCINTWTSWMTTWATMGVENCSWYYYLLENLRWPHVWPHGPQYVRQLDTRAYHQFSMAHLAQPIRPTLVGVWLHRPQRRANITGIRLLYGYIGHNIDHWICY